MGLNTLDLVVIGCYLAGVTLFGLRFRSGQQILTRLQWYYKGAFADPLPAGLNPGG